MPRLAAAVRQSLVVNGKNVPGNEQSTIRNIFQTQSEQHLNFKGYWHATWFIYFFCIDRIGFHPGVGTGPQNPLAQEKLNELALIGTTLG
ncbi:MAG: hypothetical protein J2P41_16150 [Blastocatellia bacterium]|nr:hypothetical protein [Blastocatellia bacterium]